MFLPFRLPCISSAYPSLCTLTLLWAPRGWAICLPTSGQRKLLVADKEKKVRWKYLFPWVPHCNTAVAEGLGYCSSPHPFWVLLDSGNPSFISSAKGKELNQALRVLFFVVSLYFAHTSVNSHLIKLSSNYSNLSVPSVFCWDPNILAYWYDMLHRSEAMERWDAMIRDRYKERLMGILRGKEQPNEDDRDISRRDHDSDYGFF